MSYMTQLEQVLQQRNLINDQVTLAGPSINELWALALLNRLAYPTSYQYHDERGNYERTMENFWRGAVQQGQTSWLLKKDAETTERWHAEWQHSEMENIYGHRTNEPGLLAEPANIDLKSHESNARSVSLCYYGKEEEMPLGVREQEERWNAPILIRSPETVRLVSKNQGGGTSQRTASSSSMNHAYLYGSTMQTQQTICAAPWLDGQQREELMEAAFRQHQEFFRLRAQKRLAAQGGHNRYRGY